MVCFGVCLCLVGIDGLSSGIGVPIGLLLVAVFCLVVGLLVVLFGCFVCVFVLMCWLALLLILVTLVGFVIVWLFCVSSYGFDGDLCLGGFAGFWAIVFGVWYSG